MQKIHYCVPKTGPKINQKGETVPHGRGVLKSYWRQDCPKMAQDGHEMAQNGPKTAEKGLNMDPR